MRAPRLLWDRWSLGLSAKEHDVGIVVEAGCPDLSRGRGISLARSHGAILHAPGDSKGWVVVSDGVRYEGTRFNMVSMVGTDDRSPTVGQFHKCNVEAIRAKTFTEPI